MLSVPQRGAGRDVARVGWMLRSGVKLEKIRHGKLFTENSWRRIAGS